SLGANYRLLLSASASQARVHLTYQSKPNPMEPPMFCMLLRKHLQGGRLLAVRQIGGDRVLEIDIENGDELGVLSVRTLVAELMGRHSNLILRGADGRIIDAIRHVNAEISRVREVLPGLPYLPPPAQDKVDPATATEQMLAQRLQEASGRLSQALQATVSGLSAPAARELACRLTGSEETYLSACASDVLAARLHALLRTVPTFGPPVLLLDTEGTMLDVFPFPQQCCAEALQTPQPDLSTALETFFATRDLHDRIAQKSVTLLKTLRTHVERCEKKLALQLEALHDSARMEEYRIHGELLMANLYRLSKGMTCAQVENYYDPACPVLTIPLDLQLTPTQNAQRYFKRYQKMRSAREMAAEQKKKTEEELNFLEGQLDDLRKCVQEAELNEIRAQLVDAGYVRANHNRKQMKQLPPSKPYRYRSTDDVEILVGKNSLQNDRLTAAADGEETWLHAKGIPGSHVIIRCTGEVPEHTLEDALQLAAWYSKGQGSAQVPIDYTLRRYVKKPGGAPAGFVIYTHQHTRYVTPDEQRVKKITILEQ
ncbi:MAG: NFACT RNA binding domain-containing protein, partial [Clostridia bacterium]